MGERGECGDWGLGSGEGEVGEVGDGVGDDHLAN